MDTTEITSPQKLSNYTPQSDSSKYIRTFQKDLATATNSPQPTPTPKAVEPVETPLPAMNMADRTMPAFDASPVDHSDNPPNPKVFPNETLSLQTSDSDGIFTNARPATGAPSRTLESELDPSPVYTPDAPSSPKEFESEKLTLTQSDSDGLFAPAAEPQIDVLPTAQVASAETPVEDDGAKRREEIRARLRAKIENPNSVPTPPASETQDSVLRTGAPDFSSFDVSWIPTPVTPTAVPEAPVPQPTAQASAAPLHTYSSDFAKKIDTDNSSTFSVLAAQSDAGQNPRPRIQARRSFVPLLAGLAMLVVGVGAVVGAYAYMHSNTTVPTIAGVPSVITFDESVEVKGGGQDLLQNISSVADGVGLTGNVIVTYVTGSSDSTSTGIPQPGGVLITRLELPAPSILLRNIQDISTVGVIKAGTEFRPFVVFKVNSYERSFAGMLAWESTIASDLATWYPAYSSLPTQTPIGSSTPVVILQPTEGFTDAVVANYDVRILRDASGRSLMVYGYKGKDTLIIARDESAFTALVSRLNTAAGE